MSLFEQEGWRRHECPWDGRGINDGRGLRSDAVESLAVRAKY